ncbi:alpha/beta hydrolase [Saccharopolyspora sp. K220]|uniref:alpha/beta fold hydrolase n=1 Tax=Saccharopolyspora soli TaxID=2926618 RepID=UPI001F599DB9|nr:alpha/beta hydrolase [Saccharopolyspora soli]MCI2416562.1 alpha/beta hydrolase [Saccharopolyspora soli]
MSGPYRCDTGARLLRERYRKTLESWPVDNEQLRVPTSEGETFVIVSGPATAPPLVLLHGSGSNSAQWMSRIADLTTHFRVHAIDMIGEPGLSAPSRPPLSSDRYATWMGAVLDFLGLAQVRLMGFSLGGWLALDFATRCPSRVERLALSCPTGIGRQRNGFLLKAMLLNQLGRWGRRKTVTGMLGPGLSTMNPAEAAVVVEQVLFVSKHFRYRTGEVPLFDDNALCGLTMPVHVVVGQLDVMLDSVEVKRRLELAAPHATVRLLPGIGHFIPPQATELEFLTST